MTKDFEVGRSDGWLSTDAFSHAVKGPQANLVNVIIETNPDAEIFLIRHDLSLAANDVGRLETLQPSGLYKLRVLRGDQMKEAFLDVSGDSVEQKVIIDRLPTVGPSSSVLGSDEATFLEHITSMPVRRLRKQAAPVESEQTRLLVTASQETVTDTSPLSGIRIRPWRDTRRASILERKRRATFPAGGRYWATALVEARCGRWMVDFRIDGKRFRMSLPTVRGRLAQLSVRRGLLVENEQVSVTNTSQPARAWLDVAVSFIANSSNPKDNWTSFLGQDEAVVAPETAEAYRQALTRQRRIILSHSDILELLKLSPKDPYIGIAGAHLMINAFEAKRSREAGNQSLRSLNALQFSEQQVQDVCADLAMQFDTTLDASDERCDPDLASVLLRAGLFFRNRSRLLISDPPLYQISWETLLHHSAYSDKVSLEPRLAYELRQSTGMGPYLAWKPLPSMTIKTAQKTGSNSVPGLNWSTSGLINRSRQLQTKQDAQLARLLDAFRPIATESPDDHAVLDQTSNKHITQT